MNARQSAPRSHSWATFAGTAVLFAVFVWVTWVGSIIGGDCKPSLPDSAFAGCDVAVGHLQRDLRWIGAAIPIAALAEWRWQWRGSLLLVLAAIGVTVVIRQVYS